MIPSGRWSRHLKEPPWHSESSEAFGCGQTSCLCHFRSSILITLTSAHRAPGSPAKGRNLGEEFNLFRDVKCEVRPLSVATSTPVASTPLLQITHAHRKWTYAVVHTCTDKWYKNASTSNARANLPPLAVVTHSLLINQVFWNLSSVSWWMLFVVLLQHPTKSQPVGQYSKGHPPPRQSPAVTEHQHI